MRVPDDVFAQICAELETEEQSGELDGIFKGGAQSAGSADRKRTAHALPET